MLKTRLFTGNKIPLAQQLIAGLWAVGLVTVIGIWANGSLFKSYPSLSNQIFMSSGELFGFLATYFALVQFMLMGRIKWVEKPFGLDHLASFHRLNGYAVIIAIIIHPILLTIGYAQISKKSLVAQYGQLILHYNDVWLALIGEILFLLVVVSSVYIVRRHLKFESWYFVHLSVYVAIIVVFFHQLALGESFEHHPLNLALWYGLYIFVLGSVFIWRFLLPTINLYRYQFVIDRVVAETPTTTSLYIKGRQLKRLKAEAGQFILIRILAPGVWWQEHSFSLSMVPTDDHLRLTIRNVGDYTAKIAQLQPGARVVVSGPFGRFTKTLAQTKKRLFVAGGVGITPIRSLIEESLADGLDSQLLFANRDPSDVVLGDELTKLSGKSLKVTHVYSAPSADYGTETGYVDAAKITKLVPDFAERDLYLCGPPPMMAGIVAGLAGKINPEQIHYEQFALHNR